MYKILLKVYRMLARSAAFGLAIMCLSFPGEICNSGNISEWNSYPSEIPLSSPPLIQVDALDALLADSPKRGWSFGPSLELSTINPFTSFGGGAYGGNLQYVPGYGVDFYTYGTPSNQASLGWTQGISLTGNLAYGEGAWTGLLKVPKVA
jgi:hypothetical protein